MATVLLEMRPGQSEARISRYWIFRYPNPPLRRLDYMYLPRDGAKNHAGAGCSITCEDIEGRIRVRGGEHGCRLAHGTWYSSCMHTLVTCASERTFTQGQTDSQRRREASIEQRIRSRAREGKKEIRKQEMRCEGNTGTNSNTLKTSTGPGQKHIITIISPSQSCTPHPHINSFSSGNCYRASLLFSYSLPPPAFGVIWWLLHLLVLACFSSRAVSLELNIWSHLHHAHLESAPPTQEKKNLCIVPQVSEILLL